MSDNLQVSNAATPTDQTPEQARGRRAMSYRASAFSWMVDALEAKLGELLQKEYALLSGGVRRDVRFLHVKLESMRAVFRHFESLNEPDPQHREPVEGLRELAYDIDDWVDLFAVRVDAAAGIWGNASSRFQGWFLSFARNLTILPNSTRHTISTELKNITERLIDLNERRRDLLKEAPIERHRPSVDPRLSALYQDTGGLVGLTGPLEEVTKMVTENKAGLMTVSIVGMVGSGKTTLANQVYMRLREENCFQCQAFLSVGQEPDFKRTLRDTLSMLANGHQVDEEIENLIDRLRETLRKKRYLIVVDELWSIEHWHGTLKHCFPENSLGSRIITATRNVQLAKAFATTSDCIYNIGLLSEVDSKKLILNRAFGTGCGCPQDLEDVFAQIITRCGGLPLALVIVASMLRDQSSMGEWGTFKESRWSLISHPHAETMKRILNVSYNDLPPSLRTSLLYLSIFPENYKIDTARLVRRWIAEGFFFERHGASMGELAIRDDLNELISRNMVQPLLLNHDGVPRYCRLHPVIHDFIVCKSIEEKFATVVNVQDHQYFPNNTGIVRRLSVQSNSNQDQAMAPNDYTDLSHARSISIFGQASSIPRLTDLKMVRVLDLEGCVGPVCLDGLSTLLFLRYLSLRGTGVSELPATIRELRCLQALDVSSTKLKTLPRSIGALLRLRYLNIRDTDLSELPGTIGKLRYLVTLAVGSTKVKELYPSILNPKHSLKAILVGGEGRFNSVETVTRLPNAIQHCQCLEKLGTIDIREHHASFVKALGGLNCLRVLKITWSSQQSNEKAYREALVSSMENWIKLESLTIHCGFLCSLEFLGSLPNPPRELKKFKVTAGRFAVIPQWIRGLGLLSFMQITVCKLGSDDLRILKDLPRLKCLILGLEFIPRVAIEIENEGFKELTRFSVDCPVPWLTFSTGAMRKLTYLELKFCSGPASQKSVPSGIDNLLSLREVVLCYNKKWCANSSSVKMTVAAVKEEVSRHHNPIQLVINGTRVDVQQAEEAAEIHNEAEHGGEAKDDVEVAGEGTSKISSSSEIEEIEDDAEHGL